jgi:hypothetical protein
MRNLYDQGLRDIVDSAFVTWPFMEALFTKRLALFFG